MALPTSCEARRIKCMINRRKNDITFIGGWSASEQSRRLRALWRI